MTNSNNLIGYHGTTIESADKIIATGAFNFSNKEEEWLGKGVYFFEDDIEQAVRFCTKARNYPNYSVLKSEITANRCINLDNSEAMEKILDISNKIKGRYLNLKDGVTKRKLTNSVILEAMYKLEPYDVVKKTFVIDRVPIIERTNFVWTQVQICVRNRSCINNTREVKRYEC